MKFLMTVFCLICAQVCSANSFHHEFEGISEFYNIRNLRVLSNFLPEHPVIIEAGAYHGRDTVKLAKKIPSAKIYALEPLPTAFPGLCEAVADWPNVIPSCFALDGTSGARKFYVCHGTNGESPIFEFHSSLLKPTGSAAIHLMGPVISVDCLSLRDFCSTQGIDHIDMLWLSTEGNELQILKGSPEYLDGLTLVYAHTQLYPTRESITLYGELKSYLEDNGFILMSHFFIPNVHGDALFIKQDKIKK